MNQPRGSTSRSHWGAGMVFLVLGATGAVWTAYVAALALTRGLLILVGRLI